MLAPDDELRLLGEDIARVEAALERTEQDVAAAYERGYQRGLVTAGEPWLALFFTVAGGFLGWAACLVFYAG